jgi:rod shape-determining protein MreD
VRAALALIVIGALALVVEGALVSVLPSLLLPDVALVGSIAAALFLGGAPALIALAGLGFASDLLTGAPLGLHVLVLLVPFVATRLANGSLELRRGMSEAVLAALLTPLAGVLTLGCMRLTGVSASFGLEFWFGLALQTAVNALLAPGACALAEAVASATGDVDPTRRGVAYVGSAAWAASRR